MTCIRRACELVKYSYSLKITSHIHLNLITNKLQTSPSSGDALCILKGSQMETKEAEPIANGSDTGLRAKSIVDVYKNSQKG